MGDAYPELGAQPRDDREDDPRRGAPLRHRADRRPAAPRSGDRQGARTARRACCRATWRSGCTTRSAFPYDFIEDTAATHDVRVDRAGYDLAMQAQRDTARGKSAFGGQPRGGRVRASATTAALKAAADQFEGYTSTRVAGRAGRRAVRRADASRSTRFGAGETGFAALARTPFYLEAGGQVSDTGRLVGAANGSVAVVEGVSRIGPGLPRAHQVRVESGVLRVGRYRHGGSRRRICATRRAATTRPLTCCTRRCGRCSADTSSRRARSSRPIASASTSSTSSRSRATSSTRIEQIVNAQIVANTAGADRGASDRGGDQGRRDGALRREVRRHGARRVASPASAWSCAAARTSGATGDIGFFAIVAESGVAAGTRRIEAVTGLGALQWSQQQRAALDRIVDALHVNPDQAVDAIEKLQGEAKRLGARGDAAQDQGGDGRRRHASTADDTIEVAGVKLARRKVAGSRQGRAARPCRFAQGEDYERRRRARLGDRRQGPDRRVCHARPHRPCQSGPNREGDRAHRRRRRRRTPRLRRSRRPAAGEDRRDARGGRRAPCASSWAPDRLDP